MVITVTNARLQKHLLKYRIFFGEGWSIKSSVTANYIRTSFIWLQVSPVTIKPKLTILRFPLKKRKFKNTTVNIKEINHV